MSAASNALRHLTVATTARQPWLLKSRFTSCTFACVSFTPNPQEIQQRIYCNDDDKKSEKNKGSSYFPKRGQELELVCESLAFKGKGVCKVEETGFVVMCDRVLPGEKFIGRVNRKKGNYAEVSLCDCFKDKTSNLFVFGIVKIIVDFVCLFFF